MTDHTTESSDAACEEALTSTIVAHPDALVTEVDINEWVTALREGRTFSLGAPPTWIDVAGRGHFPEGTALLQMVYPDDYGVLTRAWARSLRERTSKAMVHRADKPSVTVWVEFYNFLSQRGSMVVVMYEGRPDAASPDPGESAGAGLSFRHARLIKDSTSTIVQADTAIESILGWTSEELIGRPTVALIHPDDRASGIEAWIQMLGRPGPARPIHLRHQHRDGRWLWIEVTNYNRVDDPAYRDIVSDLVDITSEVEAAEALQARQQLLEQVAETSPVGLLHLDRSGRILFANASFSELSGLRDGSSIFDWRGAVTTTDHESFDSIFSSALSGSPAHAIVELIGPAGDDVHCSIDLRPLVGSNGMLSGVTVAVRDITVRARERLALEALAATDTLTGCLSRAAITSVLGDAVDRAGASGGDDGVAVVFVDLDNLKETNDCLGHHAGDLLLQEVADRLKGFVRSGDSVGRLGGDEFVIVAPHVRSRENALTLAISAAGRLSGSVEVCGEHVEIRASLGVAWTSSPLTRGSWLLRQADQAMYASKREGQGRPVLAAVG